MTPKLKPVEIEPESLDDFFVDCSTGLSSSNLFFFFDSSSPNEDMEVDAAGLAENINPLLLSLTALFSMGTETPEKLFDFSSGLLDINLKPFDDEISVDRGGFDTTGVLAAANLKPVDMGCVSETTAETSFFSFVDSAGATPNVKPDVATGLETGQESADMSTVLEEEAVVAADPPTGAAADDSGTSHATHLVAVFAF